MEFPTMPKIKIEITMTNDGSHFSQEDMYLLPMYFLSFLFFTFFLGKSILEFYRDFKKEHTFENPLIPLMGSITIDFFHLMFMFIHMMFVWEFGKGVIELGVFGRLFKVISQGVMMWLMITIAFGWTITYKNMGEKDIYILSAIFIVMIHLLIGALTYIDDESHHKYHDFGGVQGVILVLLRVVIYGVFLYGIKETSNSANNKQKSFLWSLTVSATIYILSFPFLWVVSMITDRYVINRFITFGTLAAQALAAYYLLHQLTKKGSSYYGASHKSKTILPGAKFD
uniref:GPR180/TMEM145 transmembrane domain-containing protein n=1 Tax=Euplotes crassus TaxID=5936 RepID=A0A7S3NVD6_EUPCR|mmetsp:Transcript_25564/g.25357  ORF Transcript_25564/g.25357 Transcript_25564/m.25357 type:complete len:284 (+) Transcript_25564:468-1319(+)